MRENLEMDREDNDDEFWFNEEISDEDVLKKLNRDEIDDDENLLWDHIHEEDEI